MFTWLLGATSPPFFDFRLHLLHSWSQSGIQWLQGTRKRDCGVKDIDGTGSWFSSDNYPTVTSLGKEKCIDYYFFKKVEITGMARTRALSFTFFFFFTYHHLLKLFLHRSRIIAAGSTRHTTSWHLHLRGQGFSQLQMNKTWQDADWPGMHLGPDGRA